MEDEPDIPILPEDATMPRGMRAELKGVSAEIAEVVGAHMMMAAELIDTDPDLAYRHAEAARRRAPRLPLTREATAETAYAAGKYEQALAQYKTLRRMSGTADVIPVMVDCLRALGKHREALELAESGRPEIKDPSMLVELIIVTAGVRLDMGQRDEAMRILRHEMEKPSVRHPRLAQARLLYAYADMLTDMGEMGEAHHWFSVAASLDPFGTTSALDRLDELDGVVLDLDEDEFLDEEDFDDNEDQDENLEDEDLEVMNEDQVVVEDLDPATPLRAAQDDEVVDSTQDDQVGSVQDDDRDDELDSINHREDNEDPGDLENLDGDEDIDVEDLEDLQDSEKD
ncbi:MAG: tetratricopeptide repeat protein [Propionibacteriaceae bacterium]|jgi:hypothetical protein|nr:tetratricopeptide repeat protein [Propionibacteriaceae bacterium]